ALGGDFIKARNILRSLMVTYGLSGIDIIKQIHKEITSSDIDLPEEAKVELADYVGEIQFRLIEGADEEIQLDALLARLVVLGKKIVGVAPKRVGK
ncbi:MAG: replication factor C small subunit, partial [Zestosphaera sp.]